MTEHPDPERRWRNRRRMAWLTLAASLLFPGLVVAADAQQLAQLTGPFYAFCGAVVLGYLGFATWDDVEQTRRG